MPVLPFKPCSDPIPHMGTARFAADQPGIEPAHGRHHIEQIRICLAVAPSVHHGVAYADALFPSGIVERIVLIGNF